MEEEASPGLLGTSSVVIFIGLGWAGWDVRGRVMPGPGATPV
jgi:hypothetical protein